MGAHSHNKENNSDRARREKLKKPSGKHKSGSGTLHGEGLKDPKPKK